MRDSIGGEIESGKQDPVQQSRKERHSVSFYLSHMILQTQHYHGAQLKSIVCHAANCQESILRRCRAISKPAFLPPRVVASHCCPIHGKCNTERRKEWVSNQWNYGNVPLSHNSQEEGLIISLLVLAATQYSCCDTVTERVIWQVK